MTVVNGTSSPMTANEGRARQALAVLTIHHEKRPVWPIHKPSGRAINAATSKETPLRATCSISRLGMPFGPCQLSGSASHWAVAAIRSIGRPRPSTDLRPSGGPRREQPLEEHEGHVGDDRQGDREQPTHENLRREEIGRASC